MALDLTKMVRPAETAVLCNEMQRGIVGDFSVQPALVEEVGRRMLPRNISRLVLAARAHSVQVVFCNYILRKDRKGSGRNCPALAHNAKHHPLRMQLGTASAEVIPEISVAPEDIVSSRVHGMSPFTGTSLDASLRNLGVKTIIATGVSLNIGIVGMCIEAIGLGYRVVVVRDCVAGIPGPYGEAMLQNTFSALAALTTIDELIQSWSGGSRQ